MLELLLSFQLQFLRLYGNDFPLNNKQKLKHYLMNNLLIISENIICFRLMFVKIHSLHKLKIRLYAKLVSKTLLSD